MSTNDMISVIMPYWRYNGKSIKYMKEALDSLANQTYKNFELRLCLDCPDLDTITEVRKLIQNYDFKTYFSVRDSHKPSISLTRNAIIPSAEGDWIAFLDADNIWHKDWLAQMIDSARKVYPDATYSRAAPDFRTLSEGEAQLKMFEKYDKAFEVIDENHFTYYLNCPANPLFGAVMLHKDHIEKIGLFNAELEIYETSLMMAKLFLNFKVHFVKKAFLFTRIWEGAISTRGGNQKLVDFKKLFQDKARLYKESLK